MTSRYYTMTDSTGESGFLPTVTFTSPNNTFTSTQRVQQLLNETGITGLYEADFADNITTIDTSAFENDSKVVVVTINKVTTIGTNAFKGCSALRSITLDTAVDANKRYLLTSIGTHAFYGCSSLRHLHIPDTVKVIPDYLCYGCTSLEFAVMGYGWDRSGDTYNTNGTIGQEAFNNCYNLSYFVVPETVSSIGALAFANTLSLRLVNILGTPDVSSNAFSQSNNESSTIYYYNTTKDVSNCFPTAVSKRAYTEVTFSATGTLTSAITTTALTNVNSYWKGKISSGVTALGIPDTPAFRAAEITAAKYINMIGMSFPSSLTTINYGSFESWVSTGVQAPCNVTGFYFPNSVTTFAVFSGDSAAFRLGSDVNMLASSTRQFVFLSGPNTVTFGPVMFNNNSARAYIIPNITNIPNRCFYYSQNSYFFSFFQKNAYTQLTTVGADANYVLEGCFQRSGVPGYRHYIHIPKQVTYIGIDAFRGMSMKLVVTVYHNTVNSAGTTLTTGLVTGINLTWTGSTATGSRFMGGPAPTIHIINNNYDSNGNELTSSFSLGSGLLYHVLYSANVKTITNRFAGLVDLKSIAIHHSASPIVVLQHTNAAGRGNVGGMTGTFQNCTNLEFVYLNNRVTIMEPNAFRNTKLNVNFDLIDAAPLREMYHGVFYTDTGYTCNIRQITVPNTVKVMTSQMFGCTTNGGKSVFTNFSLADDIEFWGDFAYSPYKVTPADYEYNPADLTTSRTSVNYMTISGSFFTRCDLLQSVSFLDTVDANGNAIPNDGLALARPNNRFPITIRKNKQTLTWGLRRIMTDAFIYNHRLQSIRIPDGVTHIGVNAFYDAYSLTYLYLPDTLTSIGTQAFNFMNYTNQFGYDGLEVSVRIPQSRIDDVANPGDIKFNPGSKSTYFINVSFDKTAGKVTNGVLGRFTTSPVDPYIKYHVIIQNGITGILGGSVDSQRAFDNFTSLKTLTIPDTVNNIGPGAVYNCTGLTNVFISPSSNLTILGDSAFQSCRSLTSFFIPNSLKGINYNAFYDCTSLAMVTYGNNPGLKYIGPNAFYGATKALTSIFIPSSVISIGYTAFITNSNTDVNILNTVTFGAGSRLKSIDYRCFGYNGDGIQRSAQYLHDLVLPSSLRYMGSIFNTTSSLLQNTHRLAHSANLIVPSSVEVIPWAFLYADGSTVNISNIYFPRSITNVPGPRVHNGYSVNSAGVSTGLAGAEFSASRAGSLIYLPSELSAYTGYSGYPFPATNRDRSYYRTVSFTTNPLLTLGLSSGNPTSTTSHTSTTQIHAAIQEGVIVIGDGTTNITNPAGNGSLNLISVNIPSTVTTISRNAFNGCGALTYVTFSENSHLTTIGQNAFRDCTMIHDIKLPDTLTTIGQDAFKLCNNLATISIPYNVNSIGSGAFHQNKILYIKQIGQDIDGEALGDYSGYSVSLSADGLTLAIGARDNDGTSGNASDVRGHVRVYKFDATKTTNVTDQNDPNFGPVGWRRLGKDIDGEAANDQSGWSVSLSADGSTLAIAAYFNDGTTVGTTNDNRGHVRVYKYDVNKTTNVTDQSSLDYGPVGWRRLGQDIDGEAVGDNSGRSVSLSADGTVVAIGADDNNGNGSDSGHVRVYQYDPTKTENVIDQASLDFGPVGWRRLGQDIDGEAASDNSGYSVSLSADGSTVAIGALWNDGIGNMAGHVRVYQYDVNKTTNVTNQSDPNFGPVGWRRLGQDIDGEAASDQSGYSVSLSADGTVVAIGADGNDGNGADSGHVRVYKYDVNKTENVTDQSSLDFGPVGWRRLGKDIDGEAAYDYSAKTVSLSADGTIVAIGSTSNNGNGNDSGHVRVYQYDPTKTTNVTDQSIPNFGPVGWRRIGQDIDGDAANDQSGYSVSLSADGSTLAIGAWFNDGTGITSDNRGHVKVYQVLPVLTSVRIHEQLYNDISGTLSTYFTFPYRISFQVIPELLLQINDTATSFRPTNNLSIQYLQYQLGIPNIIVNNANDLVVAQAQLASIVGFVQLDINYNIPIGAFVNNRKIYSVAIGPYVTSIGDNAFSGCTNLAYLSFHPNSTCTVIGQYAFYTTALYDLVLPDSLTSIGSGAFHWNIVSDIKKLGEDIDGEAAGDFSGWSVSLSADGSTLAIGANFNDGTTVGTTSDNRGHVRVFKYDPTKTTNVTDQSSPDFGPIGWRRLGQDIDGEALGDQSGQSVSLSADGTILAIGAIYNDGTTGSTSDDRGHVRVYKYDRNKTANVTDQSDPNFGPVGWRRLGQDIDGEAAGDRSGQSVSISADGSTLAIGAYLNGGIDPGHVRVYKYDLNKTENVTDQASLDYGPVGWRRLGQDIDGATIADESGWSVSLSADGSTVAIGAIWNNGNRGHVRVYKYDPTKTENVTDQASLDYGPVGWRRLGQDINGEASNNKSGYSVSLSADGSTLAIAATANDGTTGSTSDNRGHVRVYQYDRNKTANVTDQASLDFGPVGWRRLGQDIDGETLDDQSGESVSLSADGSILAIGAPRNDGNGADSGHVRVYQYDVNKTTNVTDQSSPDYGPIGWRRLGLDIDGEAASNRSGYSVSLSADGSILAIGAWLNDGTTGDNRGHVRVYQLFSSRRLNSVRIQEQLYNDISSTLYTYFTLPSQILFNVVPELILQINDTATSFSPTISQTNNLYIRYRQYQLGIPSIIVNNANGLAIAQAQLASSVGFVHLDINYNIPVGAFVNYTKIYSVAIGPDVTSIGNNAFSGCTNLTYFSFHPNSTCTVIGANAFYNTALYDLVLPDSLTSIGTLAFQNKIFSIKQIGQDIDGEAASDESGQSVSLSADGSTLAIGAYFNDGTTAGNSGHVRVYKYDRNKTANVTDQASLDFGPVGWRRLGQDINGEAANDQSGWLVSLSADGTIVAIGANFNDGTTVGTTNDNRGHVRVYKYDPTKTENVTDQSSLDYGPVGWRRLGQDIDGEALGDQSGISVSLSADGSTVAIGANNNDGNGNNSGHVRVYKYDRNKTENVTDQANLDFGPVGWRRLGQDINGEASNDTSGTSVSISADGTIVAIGAPGNNGNSADSGHVRVYKYDLNKTENVTDQANTDYGPVGWRRLGQDINGEAGPDLAGQSVSLSADGTIVAIGANLNDGNGNSSGHVRVFKYQTISDSTWTNYNATSFSYTGTSPNNKPIVIAGGDATPTLGKSYWVQIGGDIDGEAAGDETGKLVSLSADGSTLAIGTNLNDGTAGNTSDNRGHVRVYQYDPTKTENVTDQSSTDFGPVGWRRLGPDIDGDAAGDSSGRSVSLSADGSTLAVGANFNDGTSGITGDNRGHVKVYQVLSSRPLNSVYIQEQLYNDISGTLSTYFTFPSQILFNVVPELISQDNDAAISFNPTISQTNNLSIRYLQYQLGIPTILVTNISDLAVAQTQLASIVGFVHLHINYDIPISAFANNTKIYSVAIGPAVTSIGDNAFSGCTNLAYLSFHPNSNCTVIGSNAFYNNSHYNLALPDSLTSIGSGAFHWNANAPISISSAYLINFIKLGEDIDGEATGDQSGISVSLSADGLTLAIGADANDGTIGTTSDNRGHVRVFKYQTISDSTWTNYNATSLTYTGTSPNNKPIVVAGGDATPTPGKSYWVQIGGDIDGEAAIDQSGYSVSLSADGLTVAIGARNNDGTTVGTTSDNRGHVRVFKYQTISGSTWTNYNATSFTYTGTSPNNKPIVVAGGDATPTPGKSYWVQIGGDIDGEALGDTSGWSVSLSADGTIVAIGATNNDGTTGITSDSRGHVRVYKYDVNKTENVTLQSSDQYGPVGWRRLGQDIDGEALGDTSGSSVSLSADGLTVAIGARNNDGTTGINSDGRGHVRVYKYDVTKTDNVTDQASDHYGPVGWRRLGQDIDGEAAGYFLHGHSVSLSADGSTVAIGMGANNDNGITSGHVRVYKYDVTKTENVTDQSRDDFGPVRWRRLGKDIDGDAAYDGSAFSYPVSLSADGTIVAIGAPYNDGTSGNTSDNRGHVRVFKYDVTKTENVTDQDSDDYGPVGWRRLGGQDIDGDAANDNSGWSVSLSADGSTLAIAAIANDGTTGVTSDNRGHVRVYKLKPTYDASVYIHEDLYNNISGTLSTYFTNLSNISFVVVRDRIFASPSRITISQINNFYIRYRQYQLGIPTITVDNIFDLAFVQAQAASSLGFVHLYINCDIPANAFTNNTNIYSVAIGPDVTSIGFNAFYGCTNLTYLSFHPDSVCTTIGQGAFLGNNIFDLVLPDSLTSIVAWSFQNSMQLTSVCIPNKVTTLGTSAFYNCSKLTSVTVPASIFNTLTSAYFNTNGSTLPTNMSVYNSYMDHAIPHFKLSDYSIPSGIVQNVIPSEVTYIDHRAYAYYPEITLYAVNIPQTSGPYSYAANGVNFPIMPAAFLVNGSIVSNSTFPLYRSVPDLNVFSASTTEFIGNTDDFYILMPGYSICIYNNLYDEENLFTDAPTYRYYDNEFGKVPLTINIGAYNAASSILFMHNGRILSKKFVN